MDIINIISKAPGMLDQLKALGLSSDQAVQVGGEISQQLRDYGEPDLTDLLSGLDIQGFIGKIDLEQLASQTGIDVAQAQSVIETLAPAVQAFSGDTGSLLGGLGSAASKLFDRD